MELTKRVKDQLNKAETEEEIGLIKKEMLKNVEEAGLILSEAELDEAAGGYPKVQNPPSPMG